MLIGELVKRSGLSRDTIRFYEKHGLITVGRKDRRENNYKEYSEEILKRLLNIKHLKNFGFTLNECAEVIEMIESNEATCQNMSGKVQEKIDLLNNKIAEMIRVKTILTAKINECGNQCDSFSDDENCSVVISEILPGNCK